MAKLENLFFEVQKVLDEENRINDMRDIGGKILSNTIEGTEFNSAHKNEKKEIMRLAGLGQLSVKLELTKFLYEKFPKFNVEEITLIISEVLSKKNFDDVIRKYSLGGNRYPETSYLRNIVNAAIGFLVMNNCCFVRIITTSILNAITVKTLERLNKQRNLDTKLEISEMSSSIVPPPPPLPLLLHPPSRTTLRISSSVIPQNLPPLPPIVYNEKRKEEITITINPPLARKTTIISSPPRTQPQPQQQQGGKKVDAFDLFDKANEESGFKLVAANALKSTVPESYQRRITTTTTTTTQNKKKPANNQILPPPPTTTTTLNNFDIEFHFPLFLEMVKSPPPNIVVDGENRWVAYGRLIELFRETYNVKTKKLRRKIDKSAKWSQKFQFKKVMGWSSGKKPKRHKIKCVRVVVVKEEKATIIKKDEEGKLEKVDEPSPLQIIKKEEEERISGKKRERRKYDKIKVKPDLITTTNTGIRRTLDLDELLRNRIRVEEREIEKLENRGYNIQVRKEEDDDDDLGFNLEPKMKKRKID